MRQLISIGDIADNLSKVGRSLGWVSAVNSAGRTIWIADAHRDGKRYLVRQDEKLTTFFELESPIRARPPVNGAG